MNQQAAYTPYHPRWHRQRISTYWWLERPSYFLFILRELSSLAFIGVDRENELHSRSAP